MLRRIALCAAAICAAATVQLRAQEPAGCRLALAIGMDVSASVDAVEYRLQLDGLAAALLDDEVQRQVLQNSGTPIWIAAFEWAGRGNQRLLMGWTALDSRGALRDVAAQLRATRRGRGPEATGIGDAMLFAETLFAQKPGCWEYTLDLSGDGINNDGPPPEQMRDTLVGRNINGLVVALDLTVGRDERQMTLMELSAYYRRRVIQGPRAFIEVAQGFADFERAMTRKLLRETETLMLGSR